MASAEAAGASRDRRRTGVIGGTVAVVVLVLAVWGCSRGDDQDGAPTAPSDTEIAASPTDSTAPTDSSSTSPALSATATAAPSSTSGQPAISAASVDTELPPLSIPLGTIPGQNAVDVSAAITDRLETYRRLAVENPIAALRQLLAGMDEFELEIFTAAELQPWGDQIIEQLVNVRREWSTAISATEAGDPSEAQARAAAALAFLDAAIAVPCPEP